MSTTVLILVVALALAAAGAVYQAVASRRSSRRHAPPGSFVDAGGYRLHVICAGTGAPPVVFEAGIAASSLSWTRVLPEVARFTSGCAYDRAGLGWSETPGRPRRFADVVRDLHTVLVARGFAAPCVLVGHSFGCFIVCAYAAAHRQDVGGLVLIDPPAASEWRAPSARQARMIWGGIQLSRVGALLATLGVVRACGTLVIGGTPGLPRAFLRLFGPTAASTVERLIGEIGKLPAEVYPLIHAHWAQPKCFRALADHLRVLEEGAAFIASLQSLPDVPLVAISSGRLPPERIEEHRALARLSSAGRHLIAERSGHWIPFDEPQLIVNAIADIVKNARAASPQS